MSHLDPETIAAFAGGRLPREASARVMAHIEGCNACRIAVSDASFELMKTRADDDSVKPPEDLEPGAMVASAYRVDGAIGRGSMGAVYRATHVPTGAAVAIKAMASTSSTAVARFLREAETCARLRSEHVARVFDAGRLPSGTPYLVMELLSGEDLATVVSRGPQGVRASCLYVSHASAGLAEAHAIGVVHRDVKPDNLFLTWRADRSPLVKVLDFGVAKITESALDGEGTLTATQALLGTPSYMAPEQLFASKNVDARADVWSLGVVLYQLLTGRLPFAGANTLALVHATSATVPAAISSLRPDVPREVEEAVERCLEPDPARRLSSASELGRRLSRFVT